MVQLLWKTIWQFIKGLSRGASLVVQWLRICFAIQGSSLVREDATCHRAIKPVYHNY